MRLGLLAVLLVVAIDKTKANNFVCFENNENLCFGISPADDKPPTVPYKIQVKLRSNQDAKNVSEYKSRFVVHEHPVDPALKAFSLLCCDEFLVARPDPSDGQIWLTNDLGLNDTRVWFGPGMSQEDPSDPSSYVCATPMQCKDKPPEKPWCNPVANDPVKFVNNVDPGSYVKVRPCDLDLQTQDWVVTEDCAPGCTMDLFLGPDCSPACNVTECVGGACGITLSPTAAPINHTEAPTAHETEAPSTSYEYETRAPSVSPNTSYEYEYYDYETKTPSDTPNTPSPTAMTTSASPTLAPTSVCPPMNRDFTILFSIICSLVLLAILVWSVWMLREAYCPRVKRPTEDQVRQQLDNVNTYNSLGFPEHPHGRQEYIRGQISKMEKYLEMVRDIGAGRVDWVPTPPVSSARMRNIGPEKRPPTSSPTRKPLQHRPEAQTTLPPRPVAQKGSSNGPVVDVDLDDATSTRELIEEAERTLEEATIP